jgi:two-component sensor histidine kinase
MDAMTGLFTSTRSNDDPMRMLKRVTIGTCLLFWAATFVTDSIVWGLAGIDPLASAFGKLVGAFFGVPTCLGLAALLYRWRDVSLPAKLGLCFFLALIAAPLFALLDLAIFAVDVGMPVDIPWAYVGRSVVSCFATFVSWCCLFVALLYHFQMREQEQRLAASREEALGAQMRALRYQINPHFLFNTLNSIAALVEEGASTRAQGMINSLGDFLHETLRLDPMQDTTLAQELAMQANYLAIEAERFPQRMALTVDVPPALSTARVPSLILQPLIENAIKHGVSAGMGKTRIRIGARQIGQTIELTVENDLAEAGTVDPRDRLGLGIGLRNVSERLAARFADRARLEAGVIEGRTFRVAIVLPLLIDHDHAPHEIAATAPASAGPVPKIDVLEPS